MATMLATAFPPVSVPSAQSNMVYVGEMYRVVLDEDGQTITLDWLGGDLGTWQAFVFAFRQRLAEL